MVEYVRGSQNDRWHWCKNCTQYPIYIFQKSTVKPHFDFCEQCRRKEEDENCDCEQIKRTAAEPELRSIFR